MILPVEPASILLLALILIVATLYSSVGHGGATGYLATIALTVGNTRSYVPLVLFLNILVAGVSFASYHRLGHFRFRILLPFVVASLPFAYLGASLHVPSQIFEMILAFALILAALRLCLTQSEFVCRDLTNARLWSIAMPIGAILGFVSGMIGIGGGIFLSPILILLGITDVKGSAAIASAFIVLNSLAGMIGYVQSTSALEFHGMLWPFAAAIALAAAQWGSRWGAASANRRSLRFALAAVLLLAGTKMIGAAL